MQTITLRKINECNNEQRLEVRLIRNQQSVRIAMYTGHEITLEEHLSWIKRLENDNKQIVFVVLLDDKVLGVVSINALDKLHKKSDWAFYLDENQRGGLGAALEFALINYAFDDLKLEKLNCEVIETNPAVVKMHKKFAFKEEGFRRSNIEKNGERIGVYFLGLTKMDWVSARDIIANRYQSILGKLFVQIEK